MNKKIAVLTAGGDCPGINAVIRAVTKTAVHDYGMDVVGIEDGYLGLIEGRWRDLDYDSVSGILTQGGTILGTSNKANPFKYAIDLGGGKQKRKKKGKDGDEQSLPPGLAERQTQAVLDALTEAKKTRPPKRFTEATLLTAMETCSGEVAM